MRGMIRRISIVLLVLIMLAGVSAGIIWWSIRTEWFAHAIQARLISSLHTVTGGRVEIDRFRFDPATLHARVDGLIVHGTEPAGAAPLLSVESAEIGLKVLSLWRRDIDIQSLTFVRPSINLLVDSKGGTNIPNRSGNVDIIGDLLDLKIGQLTVRQGLVRLNSRQMRLQLQARDLGLLLHYEQPAPSYGLRLQTDLLALSFETLALKPVHVSATGRLSKDRVQIESLGLYSAGKETAATFSGEVRHLANPLVDGTLNASLSIDELTRLGGIHEQLQGGRAELTGTIHFDATASKWFSFSGRGKAQGVDLFLPQLKLRGIAADAEIVAIPAGMLLRHAEASVEGAHFTGDGSIRDYQWLQMDGRVSQIALPAAGRHLTGESFPWSGTAHGTVRASAHLRRQSDLAISASITVEPGTTGIPTRGNVDVSYRARGNEIEFGESVLQLPHTSLQFKGSLSDSLDLQAGTSDLRDVVALIPILKLKISPADLPEFAAGGNARFDGALQHLIAAPAVQGAVSAYNFQLRGYGWNSIAGRIAYSASQLSIPQFQAQASGAKLNGSAAAELSNGTLNRDGSFQLNARFSDLNIVKAASALGLHTLPAIQGIASGNIDLKGSLRTPHGSGSFQIANLDAYGEQLNRILFDALLSGDEIRVSKGRVQAMAAVLTFAGSYRRSVPDWSAGVLQFQADTEGFPLSSSSLIRKYLPALNAQAELHVQATGKFSGAAVEPQQLKGTADFARVAVNGRELGRVTLRAATEGKAIDFTYLGDLRETKFHGSAQAQLGPGVPVHGGIEMEKLNLATLKSLFSDSGYWPPVNGSLEGNATFDGLLAAPRQMRGQAVIKRMEMAPANAAAAIVLNNNQPISIDISDGALHFSRFELDGRDTGVIISGVVPFNGNAADIKVVGNADLALFTLFDPNVRSSGHSELAVNVSGPLFAPNVSGSLEVRDGSFFLPDFPNGLSDVNGSVVFSRNRATIQKMSAHSGGGDIALGGTVGFGSASPLVYHLEATAREVRVRYANSISVTANANLRLSGTSASSILSGTLTVNRVVFTPNADAGSLLAAVGSAPSTPADQGDFISGLHLDVSVESAPNLQVSTNLSRDVEAEIQLSLRGTPEHPIVLGNIVANQGDLKIFGTRFSLNRGEVTFVNTVRIEPVLDLDLETQARGVTVDITVSGTPSKLNFNYRSDPPLQPRDIIALLTVGRTPGAVSGSNAQSGSDVSALKSGVNSVLGQAISPVSNRLSKLFGITSIKIDPFVQGITNTPQARLSIEQQISRNVTVTYVTNLSQTSEQIFRFEWALSRQFSIVALRDDNGEFGIDFQYKKRFK